MLKLHLGCGRKYLEGYINIDYDTSSHTVQDNLVADRYCDIVGLEYSSNEVDEIRLHHVFEHFSRPVALALLCRWRDWLTPRGMLRIETPDLMRAARRLSWPFVSYTERQQIVRHLFGSHEANWAAHWDGWYKGRFERVLEALGFRDLKFAFTRWGALHNIEVHAKRGAQDFSFDGYKTVVTALLSDSLIRKVEMGKIGQSEKMLLQVWIDEWESTYLGVKNI